MRIGVVARGISNPQNTPHRRSKRNIRIHSKATATPGNGVGWFKVQQATSVPI